LAQPAYPYNTDWHFGDSYCEHGGRQGFSNPTKPASFGAELVHALQITGNRRYPTQRPKSASTLAARSSPEIPINSVAVSRCTRRRAVHTETLVAFLHAPTGASRLLRLFAALIELNQGDANGIRRASRMAIDCSIQPRTPTNGDRSSKTWKTWCGPIEINADTLAGYISRSPRSGRPIGVSSPVDFSIGRCRSLAVRNTKVWGSPRFRTDRLQVEAIATARATLRPSCLIAKNWRLLDHRTRIYAGSPGLRIGSVTTGAPLSHAAAWMTDGYVTTFATTCARASAPNSPPKRSESSSSTSP